MAKHNFRNPCFDVLRVPKMMMMMVMMMMMMMIKRHVGRCTFSRTF